MNIQEIAKKIGVPLEKWKGRCHEIAYLILKKKIFKGKLQYGHYHGEIAPTSIFAGRTFTHHGWIKDNNTIIDPTRWVFEDVKPYIFIGKNNGEYDFGGNKLKKMYLKPPPEFDDSNPKKFSTKELNETIKHFLIKSLGIQIKKDLTTINQMVWIANLPLDMLGVFAEDIYKWIVKNGFKAFIPIDNREEILGKI
jgi:hypothetical protein